jgi:thiol-disulfide isomerase/thioredoxin
METKKSSSGHPMRSLFVMALLSLCALLLDRCTERTTSTVLDVRIAGADSGTFEITDLSSEERIVVKTGTITGKRFGIRLDSLTGSSSSILPFSLSVLTKDSRIGASFPLPLSLGQRTELEIDLTPLNTGKSIARRMASVRFSGNPQAIAFSELYDTLMSVFTARAETVIPGRIADPGETESGLKKRESDAFRRYLARFPGSRLIFLMMAQQLIGTDPATQESDPMYRLADSICLHRKAAGDTSYLLKILEQSLCLDSGFQPDTGKFILSARNDRGGTITEKDLQGRYMLVDFWATWCAPCIKEMKHLEEIHGKYSPRSFRIVAISTDSDAESWKRFIRTHPYPWLQLIDDNQLTSRRYRVRFIPYNLVVDPEGKIIARNLHGKELEKFLENSLKDIGK